MWILPVQRYTHTHRFPEDYCNPRGLGLITHYLHIVHEHAILVQSGLARLFQSRYIVSQEQWELSLVLKFSIVNALTFITQIIFLQDTSQFIFQFKSIHFLSFECNELDGELAPIG